MSSDATCRHCGADWGAGDYSEDCGTCGGGAMERACPACDGLCDSVWRRAVVDSSERGDAHWIGHCRLAEQALATIEWWLDESALPTLIWACTLVALDGRVLVLDSDGSRRLFDSEQTAVLWLREDEYQSVADLKADGAIHIDQLPPDGWLLQRVGVSLSGQYL